MENDYVKFVESHRYFNSFDDFIGEHPGIDAECLELLKPCVRKSNQELFSFLFGLF
jgi:hypothetical protein